jgi:acetyl-CoA acetyltransferase|tara:strand:- start:8737 stop:9894 length:1158 start_codon:yes stop_codon:yes gene_type:complete
MIESGSIAIVGAAESTNIGVVPNVSSTGLAIDAAANALADAGLRASDIDGFTCGYFPVADMSSQLGIYPSWADNTVVGGCSWMFQLRNAMAAINAGFCTTVLIVYGESGKSTRGLTNSYDGGRPGSIGNQFDAMYGGGQPAATFTLPVLRYQQTYGLSDEDLAVGAVSQREWAADVPRATLRELTTVEEVLSSPMVAWPIRRAMCCLVSDAGGALVVTSADRAKDMPQKPVYILGSGGALEGGLMSPAGVRDPLKPEFIRTSGDAAFSSAGITHADVDHLMIYDAFIHTPIFGLEGLGFVDYGEGGAFIADGHTAPGGSMPMNTSGGGMSYAHTGAYGMLCMLESIRQVRGNAANQVPGVTTSLCHGWGGFWSACSTFVFSNEQP